MTTATVAVDRHPGVLDRLPLPFTALHPGELPGGEHT